MESESRHSYTGPEAAKLGIIVHPSCAKLGSRIDEFIRQWRGEDESTSFIIESKCSRFGSGEAKAQILESVRGMDLYILADVLNYSLEYDMYGRKNCMSPDDIYADIKRLIMAVGGKASRITVVMPFLYESRQHRKTSRESLDAAYGLQELVSMGVDDIITFDAHDPRIQNSVPLEGFDNVMPTYQTTKALLDSTDDLILDSKHLMCISPDEGAMQRAIFFASALGVDVGMFYKRRDYSQVVDGRNPIVAHEFLGDDVKGKDVIIIDDMVASGESVIDIAKELKSRECNRIFCVATFGLFTKGLGVFDKAYEEGLIYKVITTNGIYQMPELFDKPWYVGADLSKYIALIIDSLNHDMSISKILEHYEKIHAKIEDYRAKNNK